MKLRDLFVTEKKIQPLILRVSIGMMFMAHGSQKLFGAFGGHGIQGFASFLSGLGLPFPTFQAYLAACSEFFGGFLLIIGLATRFATVPLMVTMLVAIFKVHWSKGFFGQDGGFEYPLVLLIILCSLAVVGGGRFSVDRRLATSEDKGKENA